MRTLPKGMRFLPALLMVLGMLFCPQPASAQSACSCPTSGSFESRLVVSLQQEEPPLIVEIDRSSISSDETLLLTVTIRLGTLSLSVPRPELPLLEDFRIVGSSSSTQVSIVNGSAHSEVTYQYRLQPLRSGELTIGAVQVTINRVVHTSEPIVVQVSQGNSATQGSDVQLDDTPPEADSPRFYATASVDKLSPYVGEGVVYTFRFYQAVNFYSQPLYAPPDFGGFWSETDESQRQYSSELNGRTYRVTELNTILFPMQSGELVIAPARLKIPGDFFDPDVNLSTESISLQVKPLPDGAPEGFQGAVGQYEIHAALDTQQGQVNQPLTLIITLQGRGNIQNLSDPVWSEISAWRSFASKATIQKEVQEGELHGSRTYERLLVPAEPGDYTLPSISYTFFDPAAEEYRTIATQPLNIQVMPGADEEPQATQQGQKANDLSALSSEARYLKSAPGRLRSADLLVGKPVYWLAWLLPLAALAVHFAIERRQRFEQERVVEIRSSRPGRRALHALRTAQRAAHDPHLHASRILHTYLAEKLNQPTAGLTHRSLDVILEANRLSVELREQLLAFLQRLDQTRYAPQVDAGSRSGLLSELEEMISRLENAFSAQKTAKRRGSRL